MAVKALRETAAKEAAEEAAAKEAAEKAAAEPEPWAQLLEWMEGNDVSVGDELRIQLSEGIATIDPRELQQQLAAAAAVTRAARLEPVAAVRLRDVLPRALGKLAHVLDADREPAARRAHADGVRERRGEVAAAAADSNQVPVQAMLYPPSRTLPRAKFRAGAFHPAGNRTSPSLNFLSLSMLTTNALTPPFRSMTLMYFLPTV